MALAGMTFGAASLAGAMLLMGGPIAASETVTVGTGGLTGVYHPVGAAICMLVDRGRADHGVGCVAEPTDGSVFNVGAVRAGDLDFGIVQSDVQYNAVRGLHEFADAGEDAELRFVFSVHPEPFTLVVHGDSGIRTFDDLLGKRVNIGNPGSGQRATMDLVMERSGWTADDFALVSELSSREQAGALCADEIDAFVFTVGHPSESVARPIENCDARLVDVAGPAIDDVVDEFPYYFRSTIPAGMYRNERDVTTFGVGATFVSSTATPSEAVYAVVKSVFDDLPDFTELHPALAILRAQIMATAGRSAPYHDGARRYYEEVGLIEAE